MSYQHKNHNRGAQDSILQDLIPEFLTAWKRDISEFVSDNGRLQNMEELSRFGHTIKGSFLQFGFTDLSTVGKLIMTEASKGNWQGAKQRLHGLLLALREIEKDYK